jgi:YbbR domain-containing protein
VDWAGKMRQDLVLTQVKVSPERIQVTGPKEILDNRTTLYTEKVYVDNLEKSGSLTAQILFSPASLKPASGARDRVVVEFTVKERVPQP